MRTLLAWLLLSLVAHADTLVVVTMDRCIPCQNLKRDLKNKPEMYAPHFLVVLEGREAIKAWKVTSVPTLIRVREGREVARHVGYTSPADVVAILED